MTDATEAARRIVEYVKDRKAELEARGRNASHIETSDPVVVARALLAGQDDKARIAALEAEVARLRGALEWIAESVDAGRHDGLSEPQPCRDQYEMWLHACAALEAAR